MEDIGWAHSLSDFPEYFDSSPFIGQNYHRIWD